MRKQSAVLPEIVFGASDSADSARISRLVAAGQLRKLGPRVYTSNLVEDPAQIVVRNAFQIAGHLFPGAVVGYRTAIEAGPAKDGSVFLTYKYQRNVPYPGITFKLVEGPGVLPGDTHFVGVHMASRPRALLENLSPSRARAGVARTLTRAELEEHLDRLRRAHGPDALNRYRDEARALAPQLKLEKEFGELDDLIGTLLGSRSERMASGLVQARVDGDGYDPKCLERVQSLFAHLRAHPMPAIKLQPGDPATIAFFEAYFSNFIEGTEFEVDEARAIVFEGHSPADRPADGRDVFATYQLTIQSPRAASLCKTGDEFEDVLRAAHALLMAARPDKRPGELKTGRNRFGQTTFVEPELMRGTLRRGHELILAADDAFARALLVQFLVSDVHPFDDGNGRMSRIMMRAELNRGNLQPIMIPNVYRDDYLTALRALTRNGNPATLVRTMHFAQEVGAAIDFSSYETAKAQLQACNAFEKPSLDIRLRLPRAA